MKSSFKADDPDGRARAVTEMLLAWNRGDPAALDRLTPLVYEELRRLAVHYVRRERPGHTLQATALVHEAYLRLVDQRQVSWQSRAHFLGIAAALMRRILLKHAHHRQAAKRGGGAVVTLSLSEAVDSAAGPRAANLMALEDALRRLEALDPRKGRVVELRFFGGLTEDEAAEVLGVAAITVKREWRVAKAWLQRELKR